MRLALLAAMLAAALGTGCTKPTGASLMVVTVDAVPALTNIELLHTISMAGGETVTKDVGGDGPVFSLGGGETKDFGVEVRAAITGTFSITVEARDGAGNVLGVGEKSAQLSPGKRTDLTVTLGPPGTMPDLGSSDLSPSPDLGEPDLAESPDLKGPTPPPVPVWIGTGGSAASGTKRLNMNVGGFNVVGNTQASGKTISTPFAIQ